MLLQPARPAREIAVPTLQPSTVAGEPPATVPPPPTTRAPISLSPEPRVPFRARTRLGRTTRVAGYSCGLPYPTRHTKVRFPATTQHSVRGNWPFTLIFCQRRWT